MLSINEARRKYSDVSAPDRLLIEEHQRQLGRHVVVAIDEGHESTRYEVPWMIAGPWPLYNVDEVTMHLIQYARSLGYNVRLVHREPNIIELWGWAKSLSNPAAITNSSGNVTAGKRKSTSTTSRSKPSPKITINDAKRGVLSSRLRQRVARLKNQF